MTRAEQTGVFVVSIDVEMAWGQIHHARERRPDSLFDQERKSISALLHLMQLYEISGTWALVGHLFLDGCKPTRGIHHPEVQRAAYPWLSRDWFSEDPATSAEEDPWWYGPDLVEAIRSCAVAQEIGSHSFSHQIIGDPACGVDTFRSELSASVEAARAAGVQLSSFVYPRNSIGHTQVLVDYGFVSYRGPRPRRFPNRSRLARRLLCAADMIKPMRDSAARPSLEGSLCNVPQTYLFDPDSRTARLLGERLWAKLMVRRLNQAVRHASLFHLWFHSHDISKAPGRALRALERIFQVVETERAAGGLVNMTMSEVATQALARAEK